MKGYFVSPAAPPGFDELSCHCGASVIYPPVPCGTRPPECTQTCARVHDCDHPGGSHPLASTPLSSHTMSFRIFRGGLHCSEIMLWWHPLPPQLLRGCFLWRWVCDWSRSWESQCPTLLCSVDVKHTWKARSSHWSCLSGAFFSFLVASTFGAYFKVEHLFTKLKVTSFVVVIEAIYVYYIKRKKKDKVKTLKYHLCLLLGIKLSVYFGGLFSWTKYLFVFSPLK